MRYLFLLYWVVCSSGFISAQAETEIEIAFRALLKDQEVKIEEMTEGPSHKDVQIEVLKFYISKLELYDHGELVFVEPNSYHLVDVEDPNSLKLRLSIPEDLAYSNLRFCLGVDSLTNVSGAYGEDLDPTKGMYWTWQSGYINFKLEGISPECPARQNRFVYHIGGYQAPHETIRELEFDVIPGRDININIRIDKVFDAIDVSEAYHLMSPGKEAAELSLYLPSLFSLSDED